MNNRKLSMVPEPASASNTKIVEAHMQKKQGERRIDPLLSLLFSLVNPFDVIFVFHRLDGTQQVAIPDMREEVVVSGAGRDTVHDDRIHIVGRVREQRIEAQVLQGFVCIVANENFDALRPAQLVVDVLRVFHFIIVEFIRQHIDPILHFFLLHFGQLVISDLEFVADIGSVDRFVAQDQFDDLRHVRQFVVAEIPKRCIESRIEKKGLQQHAGGFLFQLTAGLVDVVDQTGFALDEFVAVGPVEDVLDFSLRVQGTEDR